MTGRRPDRTQAFNFLDDFREVGADWITLPQHFKNHGYITLGGGKTFHPGLPKDYDEPYSWSQEEDYFAFADDVCDPSVDPVEPYAIEGDDICTVKNESALWDYRMASKAIEWINKYAVENNSVFLAIGMRRPHLKNIVPRRFFEFYPSILDTPVQRTLPRDIHNIEWYGNSTITLNGSKVYSRGPWEQAFDDILTSELRRGYYASVSWVDSQIGRVVAEVDKLGMMENTIFVLHGDHGYQLGEKACWRKLTNFELGTRVPLIITALPTRSKRVPYPVELVDIYKTLSDLAGVFMFDFDYFNLSLCPAKTVLNRSAPPGVVRPGEVSRSVFFR